MTFILHNKKDMIDIAIGTFNPERKFINIVQTSYFYYHARLAAGSPVIHTDCC